MIDKKKNFLIVGLGLMGGSYAEKLSLQSYKVFAIDQNFQSINIGKKRRIIKNKNENEDQLIQKADYIILAIPPKSCPIWIKNNVNKLKENVLITDMMGVKSHFVNDIQSMLSTQEFISMHPMTGKEYSGINYASSNIFNSSNMLIVPTDKNTNRGMDFAYDLAKILGVKNISVIDVATHDQIVGYVSHLSHVISVAFMNSYESKSIKNIAGTSFKDITRIANINENIWTQLFLENKKELLPLIEKYIEELNLIKDAISNDDEDKLKSLLKESRIKREAFNKEN